MSYKRKKKLLVPRSQYHCEKRGGKQPVKYRANTKSDVRAGTQQMFPPYIYLLSLL